MSEVIRDLVKRLFEAKDEWAGIDIGPIEGSNHMTLEQHAGFGSGILVMRLDAGKDGEYFFSIEDFHAARQLAHGLLGWADVAERLYRETNEEIRASQEAPAHE